MKTAVREAWDRSFPLSLLQTTYPSAIRAVEQRSVEVSIVIILSIFFEALYG